MWSACAAAARGIRSAIVREPEVTFCGPVEDAVAVASICSSPPARSADGLNVSRRVRLSTRAHDVSRLSDRIGRVEEDVLHAEAPCEVIAERSDAEGLGRVVPGG